MGISMLGLSAGYEGANANLDNQALQDRLAAQEKRAQQDQDFVQYQRNIAESNRTGHLADAAAIKAKYDALYPSDQSSPQQSSSSQSNSQSNSDNSNQSSQDVTPTPLFKVGGLKTSVPVNVVSPQSSTSGQTQQSDQSTQSPPSAMNTVLLNSDGSVNNDAINSLGTVQPSSSAPATNADGTPNVPAVAIAVPDPRSSSATQGSSDSGSNSNTTTAPSPPAALAAASNSRLSVSGISGASISGSSADQAASASAPDAGASSAASSSPGPLTNAATPSTNKPIGIQPAGVPQSRNFNTTLDQQLELLDRDVTAGRIDSQGYSSAVSRINQMKSEGIHQALDLMAQGQYQQAIDRYNSVGMMRGVRLVNATDGVTKINGIDQDTKNVTLTDPSGQITKIDVAKAQNQLLAADQRMALADKASNTNMMDSHYQRDDQVHATQANTMEGYRTDQASNFREQRRLQEMEILSKANQQAPIWSDKADARNEKLYTQPDPTTGQPVYDPTGAMFSKQVGLARARANGGDIMSGLDYAYQTDLSLKQAAGGDPAKLTTLRQGYLNSIVPKPGAAPASNQAPASSPASNGSVQAPVLSGNDPGSPYWSGNPGDTNKTGLTGQYSRDQIVQIAKANNEPGLLTQYDRQVASDQKANPSAGGNAATPTAAPAQTPLATPLLSRAGGVNLSDQAKRMALMNSFSGNDLSRRQNIINTAQSNVNDNFSTQLANLKPGATRSDIYKTLTWFDDNSDYLTPAQSKQLKQARQAIGQ